MKFLYMYKTISKNRLFIFYWKERNIPHIHFIGLLINFSDKNKEL